MMSGGMVNSTMRPVSVPLSGNTMGVVAGASSVVMTGNSTSVHPLDGLPTIAPITRSPWASWPLMPVNIAPSTVLRPRAMRAHPQPLPTPPAPTATSIMPSGRHMSSLVTASGVPGGDLASISSPQIIAPPFRPNSSVAPNISIHAGGAVLCAVNAANRQAVLLAPSAAVLGRSPLLPPQAHSNNSADGASMAGNGHGAQG